MPIYTSESQQQWTSCYVYVDGQYVRAELRRAGLPDEFDPREPAKAVEYQQIANDYLKPIRIFYYDCLDSKAAAQEKEKQDAYLNKLRHLDDVQVVLGEIRQGSKGREQKGVDVQMAVDALQAAFSGKVQAIGLVTGDADFAPLTRAIRSAGPHVIVLGFKDSLSDSLCREADRVHYWENLQKERRDWSLK